MRNYNKKAKAGTGAILSVGVVALVLILGFIVYSISTQQQALTGGPGEGGLNIISSSTALTFALADKVTGAATSAVNTVGVNGNSLGTAPSTVSQGDVLEILMTNTTGMHSGYIASTTVPKSTTFIIGSNNGGALYGNASATLKIFNTNNVLTTSTGTVNQTATTGETYNLDFQIIGQDLKSTNDMVAILESNSTNDIQEMKLASKTCTAGKPASYTVAGVNSRTWVCEVPAVIGAQKVSDTLVVKSASSKTMAGNYIKVTLKSKEYFQDSNTGKVLFAIEDTLGNSKSIAQYASTVYFN